MDGKHKHKIHNMPFLKLINIPFMAILAFIAVMIGIQAGNFLYKLNINIVEKVDSQSFKNTINSSLPIIETIYNSGKSSASFTGEIKHLFSKIFEFDLDSPMTILNVQSPLFMSYYNHEYKSLLALDNENRQLPGDEAPITDKDSQSPGTGPETGGTGADNKEEDKKGEDAGNNEDGSSGDGRPAGEGTDKTGEGSTGPEGAGTNEAGQSPESGGSGNTPGKENIAQNGNTVDLQPISSITFEDEKDEDKGDNNDTVALDQMVIKNFTKHKVDIAKLLKEPLKLDLSKKGPKVLIYHTHTSESYVLKEQDIGKKDVPSFNSNPKYSVVRVGEELARYLRKYGIETLHNGTVHDKVRDAAYGVAINTLQSYVKSYPSIQVYIDVHRDGLDSSKPKLRMVKEINGKNAAQVMFVMGTNDQLPNPHWEENLKFALKVQQKLNEKYPGLARPVWLVGKRYNQHVSNQAVLIEVGGDGNLLSECIESTKYLAEALNDVINGK